MARFVSQPSHSGYTLGQDVDSRRPDDLKEISMKLVACCATVLSLTIAPAFAQTASPAPAPTTAAPALDAAGAPAATTKYTLDTPIETIAADPKGKAVLDADIPGMTSHPEYENFKAMSLNQVQPMSQGAITPEALTKTATDLATIK